MSPESSQHVPEQVTSVQINESSPIAYLFFLLTNNVQQRITISKKVAPTLLHPNRVVGALPTRKPRALALPVTS
jgi:hypothetical protein